MNKREVTEIKRRLKKESVSISKMVGCYVDSSKEKVVKFRHSFLNLEDEEFYKYLEIANKVLSGKLGNNLVELSFPTETEVNGGPQQSLMALRESGLENDDLLDAFYDHVIETYDTIDNYLILLFHDIYDVPIKTSDNLALDDSEEVYDYILCAICPVSLSKPGLSYHAEENSIGAVDRNWIVGATESGFTFPAFTDRSADIHSILVYTKNAKEPHKEFWENGLGCTSKFTSTEKKNAFTNMVSHAMGPENEETEDVLIEVQSNLNAYIEEEAPLHEKDDPIILTPEAIAPILEESGIREDKVKRIQQDYEQFFQETPPEAEELLDTKVLKDNEARIEKKVLQEKVVDLTKQLESAGVINKDGEDIDIVLKVSSDRVDQITATFVDGQRCLVIPLEADDQATVNGEKKIF